MNLSSARKTRCRWLWLAPVMLVHMLAVAGCTGAEPTRWQPPPVSSPEASSGTSPSNDLPSIDRDLMIRLCDELERRAEGVLRSGQFREKPEVLGSSGDMLDGTVLCSSVEVALPDGLVGPPLTANVQVTPVRLKQGESVRRWLRRYLEYEDDRDAGNRLEPLSGFAGAAWTARRLEDVAGSGRDPRQATARTYAISVPYMVRLSVNAWFSEGSPAKAEHFCMKITKVLVREALEALSE